MKNDTGAPAILWLKRISILWIPKKNYELKPKTLN